MDVIGTTVRPSLDGGLPVDVGEIAAHLGAQVVEERLDRDLSGLVYRDGEQVVIGVNDDHAERRRRFRSPMRLGT